MKIREINARSILSKSGITDYCINCYMGCGFGCTYCYAQLLIRKFHPNEEWGGYLDIKVNAAELLEKEIKKAEKGVVMLSTVTDPYQPMEKKYELTRKCLQILLQHQFPITVLTRSPLVTRDIDLLKQFNECTVGVSINTDDDSVKNIFEPFTPPFRVRIETLKKLKDAGLQTYAFIGPILPMNTLAVGKAVAPHVNSAFVDKLNYPQLWREVAEKQGMKLDKEFFEHTRDELLAVFKEKGIKVNALF